MPRIGFEQLPEHARLWIFAAQRELDDPERARVLEEVDRFIDQWTAHNVPLTAARDWRQGRFLMIGVDEEAAGLSGCSIDALVRRMKVLQEELGVELVNNAPVVAQARRNHRTGLARAVCGVGRRRSRGL